MALSFNTSRCRLSGIAVNGPLLQRVQMQTVAENPAIIALDRTSVTLRLLELEYLLLNLTALANHLARDKLAESDASVGVQRSFLTRQKLRLGLLHLEGNHGNRSVARVV